MDSWCPCNPSTTFPNRHDSGVCMCRLKNSEGRFFPISATGSTVHCNGPSGQTAAHWRILSTDRDVPWCSDYVMVTSHQSVMSICKILYKVITQQRRVTLLFLAFTDQHDSVHWVTVQLSLFIYCSAGSRISHGGHEPHRRGCGLPKLLCFDQHDGIHWVRIQLSLFIY